MQFGPAALLFVASKIFLLTATTSTQYTQSQGVEGGKATRVLYTASLDFKLSTFPLQQARRVGVQPLLWLLPTFAPFVAGRVHEKVQGTGRCAKANGQ